MQSNRVPSHRPERWLANADIRVIGTVLVAPTLIGGWDAEDLRLGGILTIWRTFIFIHNVRAAAQCLLPACLVDSTRIEDAGTFKNQDNNGGQQNTLVFRLPYAIAHSLRQPNVV